MTNTIERVKHISIMAMIFSSLDVQVKHENPVSEAFP